MKLKRITLPLGMALLTLWCVTGCLSNTSSVIKEFDTSGKLVKETTTQESVVKTLTDSTQHKMLWVSDQGWAAGIYFVPPASSAENPSGVFKMVATKADRTALFIPVEPVSGKYIVDAIGGFSAMIAAGRAGTLSVTSNGVSAAAGSSSASAGTSTTDTSTATSK